MGNEAQYVIGLHKHLQLKIATKESIVIHFQSIEHPVVCDSISS